MRKLTIITVLITIISLFSCTPNEREFIGSYGIDKTIALKPVNYNETLILKENHKFELSGDNIEASLHGKWKVIESAYRRSTSGEREPQATISFTYNNTTITAELRGNIFYFQHPNVFRTEKYKHALYVGLNNK